MSSTAYIGPDTSIFGPQLYHAVSGSGDYSAALAASPISSSGSRAIAREHRG